jgi:transformation/transcription domain-associated protein
LKWLNSQSQWLLLFLLTACSGSQAPPSSLFGTLMMLKAACINNACYIDRLITSFMRVLQRL